MVKQTASTTASSSPNKEGFSATSAKDCNCTPGTTAQLCGDPVNLTYERMGGKCEIGTYFCQKSIPPYTRTKCS